MTWASLEGQRGQRWDALAGAGCRSWGESAAACAGRHRQPDHRALDGDQVISESLLWVSTLGVSQMLDLIFFLIVFSLCKNVQRK